ncbi:MAG: enoyl-CoA hydratase-related protein [Pseudoxanthomonas sp.]
MNGNSDGIAWRVESGIGRIVLDNPERANAISLESAMALARAIDEVLAAAPRAIVLSANGKVFCAGGDVQKFAIASEGVDVLIGRIIEVIHPAVLRLANAPMPVVSVVAGSIGGAGIGLALSADFVLVAASMKLRTGFVGVGLSPDTGTSYFLARRTGTQVAKRWLIRSEAVDAQQCLAAGAVDAVLPDDELAAHAEALAAELASAAPASVAAIKSLCQRLDAGDLQAHLQAEANAILACAGSDDAAEGIAAFRERRRPQFGSTHA